MPICWLSPRKLTTNIKFLMVFTFYLTKMGSFWFARFHYVSSFSSRPCSHSSCQPWLWSEGMRYVIRFMIIATANWDCNELTATFAHALQLRFNKGNALLCQECILCPILIAACPLLAILRHADRNGSNKQRCNSGRSAFRLAVGVESDLRENTDDFCWRRRWQACVF